MLRRILEFCRESPSAKIGILAWTIVGIWVWWNLGRVKFDLLFSVAIASFGFSVVLSAFRQFWPELECRSFRVAFAVCSVSAFFFSSILAGDWAAAEKISFTCFGTFHLHHWFTYMLSMAFLLCIPECAAPNALRRRQWIRRSTVVSVILFMIALFSLFDMKYFPGNKSLQIEFFILSLFYAMMTLLVRSREFTGQWFRLFLVISIAVNFGIFSNGVIGIIHDSVQPNTIPSSLIFFNDSTCKP